jgi:hypothetical protein
MHFMITGERGIGKSSLLNYTRALAASETTAEEAVGRFLVINVELDPSTTVVGVVRKVEYGFRSELGRTERARHFLASAWNLVQRVEAMGFRVSADAGTLPDEILLEAFAESLAETTQRICEEVSATGLFDAKYAGVLILLDEADKARAAQLGATIKLLTERLQRRGCNHVMFGLAGLPDLPSVLADSHASSLRIFEELPLDRLWDAEVLEVIEECLARANRENHRRTEITLGAR